MGEPGRLLSMGSHRVGHDCGDFAAAAATATDIDHSFSNEKKKKSIYLLNEKDQFSFQTQINAILKNIQTNAQLHSSHMLAK